MIPFPRENRRRRPLNLPRSHAEGRRCEELKKMMVLGSYADKESGVPRCILAPISEGISKKSGKSYCIIDTDRREIIEANYPVGTILYAAMSYSTQDAEATRSVKISSKP